MPTLQSTWALLHRRLPEAIVRTPLEPTRAYSEPWVLTWVGPGGRRRDDVIPRADGTAGIARAYERHVESGALGAGPVAIAVSGSFLSRALERVLPRRVRVVEADLPELEWMLHEHLATLHLRRSGRRMSMFELGLAADDLASLLDAALALDAANRGRVHASRVALRDCVVSFHVDVGDQRSFRIAELGEVAMREDPSVLTTPVVEVAFVPIDDVPRGWRTEYPPRFLRGMHAVRIAVVGGHARFRALLAREHGPLLERLFELREYVANQGGP